MKVLAAGATGQYADHVVTALVAHGIDVRGIVHDPAVRRRCGIRSPRQALAQSA